MSFAILIQLARVFAVLSLVSVGGANAVLPEIRRQVVDVHSWMNDAAFANLFAISHAAPGPNIIMVSLIGWQLAGLAGLLTATLAVMIPSCSLAFIAGRAVNRWSDRRWLQLAKDGVVPVAIGLILASGVSMMRAADGDAVTIAISLLTAAFVVVSKRNPLWALTAGTCIGIVALHLGLLRMS
jgi:chromate transporter